MILPPPLVHSPNCRIAFLLSRSCRADAPAEAGALAGILSKLRAPDGRAIEIVIGLDGASKIEGPGDVAVRRLEWLSRGRGFVRDVMFWPTAGLDLLPTMYVPSDGLLNFTDCDAWIIFGSDEGYVPKLRPTAVYCADLDRRYSSAVLTPDEKQKLDATYLSWRHARCVFTASRSALADLTSFGGVPSNKTMLIPPLQEQGERKAGRKGPQASKAYQGLVEAILQ
jgi:hypothetical protein